MRKDSPTLHWLEQAMEEFGEHGGVAHGRTIELVIRRLKELYRLGASYKLAGDQAAREFGQYRSNDVMPQVAQMMAS